VSQVQQHDSDMWLCTELLLPRSARSGVHIVRAFNLELAHVVSRHAIPTVGSEGLTLMQQDVFSAEAQAAQKEALAGPALRAEHVPTEAEENQLRIGLMKLHWWREGLESALEAVEHLRLDPEAARAAAAAAASAESDGGDLSGVAAHAQPVLNMLAIAVRQYRLTTRWLSRMLDARERSLSEGQPADINALLAHAENTSSALLYLSLEILDVRNMHADHAASHVGKALGLLLTLRALPHSASKQQVYLPRTLLAAENVDVSALLQGRNTPELSNVVFELASVARAHLQHARQLAPSVPKEAVPVLAGPALLCDRFLQRLEDNQFDLFAPAMGLLPRASAQAKEPEREASTAGVTLSGADTGVQPLVFRGQLLKRRFDGTF